MRRRVPIWHNIYGPIPSHPIPSHPIPSHGMIRKEHMCHCNLGPIFCDQTLFSIDVSWEHLVMRRLVQFNGVIYMGKKITCVTGNLEKTIPCDKTLFLFDFIWKIRSWDGGFLSIASCEGWKERTCVSGNLGRNIGCWSADNRFHKRDRGGPSEGRKVRDVIR